MKEKHTKKDYIDSILNHCRTWCFYKCSQEDVEHLRKLVAFDLQKLGEIEREKASAIWSRREGKTGKNGQKTGK